MLECTRPRFGGVFIGAHFCQDKLQIKDMSEVALIQIRGRSLSTGYAVAFVSPIRGCLHPMPMDFRVYCAVWLTDSHIDFSLVQGGSDGSLRPAAPTADRQPHLFRLRSCWPFSVCSPSRWLPVTSSSPCCSLGWWLAPSPRPTTALWGRLKNLAMTLIHLLPCLRPVRAVSLPHPGCLPLGSRAPPLSS